MTLSEKIQTALMSSGLVDYDQRSALGIAYSWVKEGKTFVPTQHSSYLKRDALAAEIIELLQANPDEDHRGALAEARAVINEPYRRPDFTGTAKEKKLKLARAE